MNLTPLDIRKANFRKVLRGVDPEEVGAFLDVVAENYERVLQDNAKLGERVQGLEERVRQYQGMERFLQDSMLTAERLAAESRDSSRREAEKTLAEAQQRAERVLEDARDRLRTLSREIRELAARKDLYVERFRSLLESQRLILEEHQQDLDEIDAIGQEVAQLLAHEAGNRDQEGEFENGSREPEPVSSRRGWPARGEAPVAPQAREPAGSHPSGLERHDGDSAWEAGDGGAREGEESQEDFFPPRVRRQGFFDLQAEGGGE